MDVTPRELRDIEIREGFRGYNRDDVDELLERAAATVEALNERLRRLTEQVSSAEGVQGQSRETEDMLHRTLLLAQRAADEAVAEAQFKARQILDDAEAKSRAQLAEAESSARRQVDSERRRLESEVLELGSRREALLADVDGLERFESEYRARLRRALEADLESLSGGSPAAPAGRPAIHDVDMPANSTSSTNDNDTNSNAAQSTPPPLSTPFASPQPPATGSAPSAADSGPPTAEIRGLSAWDLSNRSTESTSSPSSPSFPSSTPSSPSTPASAEAASSPVATDATRAPLFPTEQQTDGEPLDDEAFFASLREAVSDQAPLGPRDDATATATATGTSFENEDEDERSGLFRRRR